MEYVALLQWLLLYAVLAVFGLPLCAALFPRFPDRGAAFAVPVSLAALTLPLYWIGHLALEAWTVVAVVLALVVATDVAARRVDVPWRAAAEPYVVFALAFVAYARFRAADPVVHHAGGEKFLHFGLLKAVRRAAALPPQDMWFAGEPVRYYFGGHLMSALLTTLTGTAPRYAYNLAMAGYFGVLVVSAYGVGYALAARQGRSRRLGGALSAFFVAFAGYVVTAVRLAWGLLPEATALTYGRPVFGAIRHREYEEAVRTHSTLDGWGWFLDRYVVEGALTEFPMYSFVKADHHGHTITTGFLVVAAGLTLTYYWTPVEERRRRLALVFGVVPAFAGLLGVMNAWVLPAVVGLTWLGLLFAPAHPATLFGGRPLDEAVLDEAWRTASATGVAAVVGALAVGWGAPFLLFGTPTNDGVGVLPPRTPTVGLLLLYGALLALFAGYLLAQSRAPVGDWVRRRSRREGAVAAVLAGGTLLAGVVVAVRFSFPALVLVGVPLLVGWFLLRVDGDDRVGFETVLLVGGLGLVLSTELVYAKVWPPDQVRWNTTLKVAIQAWTLLGLAAAGIVVRWGGDAVERIRAAGDRRRYLRAGAVVGLCLAVVLASSPFAALAFAPQVAEGGDSLDGLAGHERAHPDEMAAVAWLDEKEGPVTLLEAPGRHPYEWQNPASTLTGHPTVVGWAHQRGYRGVEAFDRRAAHVDEVYTGENRSAHLARYGVDYVYVGPIERERYGEELAPFEGPAFDVAFQRGDVTVYAVDDEALETGA
jgi:YYY domain-containing protein